MSWFQCQCQCVTKSKSDCGCCQYGRMRSAVLSAWHYGRRSPSLRRRHSRTQGVNCCLNMFIFISHTYIYISYCITILNHIYFDVYMINFFQIIRTHTHGTPRPASDKATTWKRLSAMSSTCRPCTPSCRNRWGPDLELGSVWVTIRIAGEDRWYEESKGGLVVKIIKAVWSRIETWW